MRSVFAPYVRKVIFVALTLEGFKEVVIAPVIQEHAADHDIQDVGSYSNEENGHQKFIDQHWQGKNPLSDDEMRVGYQEYRDAALAAKGLL